jgi:hypothetical protein
LYADYAIRNKSRSGAEITVYEVAGERIHFGEVVA